MALTDFLSDGAAIPAGSAVKASTSQTVLPDWYTNYAMNLLSGQGAIAATPYATYQGPRVAGFTGDQSTGFDMTKGAATAYQPGLNAAQQGTAAAAAQPGALSVAQPFINKASASSVSNLSNYMNPYNDAVVNRIAELGNRNLTENIMPGIEGRYIGAGQLGFAPRDGYGTPSGMMTDTARAIRDTQGEISAAQSAALQQGFGQATSLANTDLNRQADLATTTGGLANTQQNTQLNAAQQQAQLGGLAQQYGLAGANAVTGVGQQQQALNQQNLDVGYQDFLRQQGWSQEQINNALSTFKGVATGVPTATQEAGIVPTGQQQQYQPSTASNIASGLAGLAGLLKVL